MQVFRYVFSELVASVRVFLCLKVNVSVFLVCPICYPQFKKAQEIFELKRKELTMQAEIQGGIKGRPEEPWLEAVKAG